MLKKALESKRDEYDSAKEKDLESGFTAYDEAASCYIQQIIDELERGASSTSLLDELTSELPVLLEEEIRESERPSFDWYDDHHHEKIAMGKAVACKAAISILEKYVDTD